ncbi:MULTISPECIES: LytTR family DNA-binding domain-containing protein [unclassified Spirosoma]|uniref:LytR/AlgR family response regulator transcription factor n=1 Tax=unclassified Spirosoma TaxID=2621999 RepID=UPI0009682C7C|nr:MULTISPECIES: LytTR family DNA-binding domain-containing protein [unclassified Spirosoma]MBN8822132.1 LytTR family transcriptional regulator [Spirosoma sp.]OJW80530.1 MAG: histidine kinase [Spirosoma sp. 48-14]
MEANVFSSVQPIPVVPHFPASYQRSAQRIALPYLNRTIFISVDDILCLQGEGNYTFLYTRDRKRFLVSKTLKEFEKTLDASMFLRIHKSYIVNLAYVQRNIFNRDRQVRLADGREVAISRRRMKDISQQLAQYWHRLYN